MPIPFIVAGIAALAGAAGAASAVKGVSKMRDANNLVESANRRHKRNIRRLEESNKEADRAMDELGTLELQILKSFEDFASVFEKIKNKPTFAAYEKENVKLPEFDGTKLKEVSVGAGVLLGGIEGAGLGAAGGFAAAGATTAAVMALGTASTGTAIASLSGAAATNATLAALGGGAIAAGGGGMALGSMILGGATLGVGLLVGGIIFNITSNLTDKADEVWGEMKRAEREMDRARAYLDKLHQTADTYKDQLKTVQLIYQDHLDDLKDQVEEQGRTDWRTYTSEEKKLTENTVLLVSLLYAMCKVRLVLKGDNDELNTINEASIQKSLTDSKKILADNFEG